MLARVCVLQLKGDSERAGAGTLSHEDREVLAMSLDAVSSAVESLAHLAQSFDTHRRSLALEREATRKQSTPQQQPPSSGSETQESVEKLVRSTLSHARLGLDKLQRSLSQGQGGNRKHEHTQPPEDAKAPSKPARARRNSISIEAFGDQTSGVREEEMRAGRADRGYAGETQSAIPP